jgi:transcriptional regulator with XRE-family HTH domain
MLKKMKKVLERIISLKDADSTAEFARTVGLHPQTVDNYLTEKRKISLEFIIRICQNCNVSADWVLGFSNDRRGTSAPPSSLELQTLVSELQAENARLNAELVRVNGENVGLRYAVEALGKGK